MAADALPPPPPARPWAGKRFLDLLAPHASRAALERGRSLLRQGRVLDLTVTPGRVVADVLGTAPTPLHVRISLAVLPTSAWDRAERRLAGEASRAARLLAGEMPDDIEAVFSACGVTLLPTEALELRAECSCTEPSDPCHHVAAVYLRLAQRFDEDPFLPLAWRGRTRTQLLERLRVLRARADETAPAPEAAPPPEPSPAPDAEGAHPTPPEPPISAAGAPISSAVDPGLEGVAPAFLARPPSFWSGAPLPPPAEAVLPAPVPPDAVLREMGPLPVDDAAFCAWLATVYAAVTDSTAAGGAEGR